MDVLTYVNCMPSLGTLHVEDAVLAPIHAVASAALVVVQSPVAICTVHPDVDQFPL